MKTIFTLCITILLISCAAPQNTSAPNESIQQRLIAFEAYQCCIELSGAVIEKFEIGQTKEFLMNETKSKYRSTVGDSSFFITHAVEQDVSYYTLRSYIEKDPKTGNKFAVAPIILILNDDYSVSRMSKLDQLRYMSWTVWGQKEHFDIPIKIDKLKHPREKYIAVVTPQETLGQQLQYLSQSDGSTMVLPSGSGFMAMNVGGGTTKVEYHSSPYGVLQLKHLTSKMEIPFEWAIEF